MAQKDIQEIAQFMEAIDDEKIKYESACEEAAKEAEEAIAEEFDAYEDEVIDKSSLGFIDDTDANEADSFYAEDEEKDTFEEDVSDCIETEQIEEAADVLNLTVDVYNEDGYGKYFIQDLTKHVPTVDAKELKIKKNGDISVQITGQLDDLKKAWAFYLGKTSFDLVDKNDQEIFFGEVTDINGDTLSEADYREAVAHCLDPIDVNASTANLISKNSCSLSMVQEEIAKRSAKKMLKALKENDLSKLSDKELDTLGNIQTAIKDGADLSDLDDKEQKVLNAFVNALGYTLEEWLSFDEKKQDSIINKYNEKFAPSRTGFADVQMRTKNGKTEYYRNSYQVYDPEHDETVITAFNPNYTSDDSTYQHPTAQLRKQQKAIKAAEQATKEKRSLEAMQNARGKDFWAVSEFAQMIQHLDAKQRKALMKSMIDDVEKENTDSAKAGAEIALIKKMFGKKLTSYDLGKMWDRSHVGVQKFGDSIIGNLYYVARQVTGISDARKALGTIANGKQELRDKFAKELEKYLNSQPLPKHHDMDPERTKRKLAARTQTSTEENK